MNEITTADALAWFENSNIQMPGARIMCDKAIAALRAQLEAEKNEPLTLDELREMNGEPVWCVIKGVHEGDAPCLEAWFLIEVEEDFEGEKVKEKGFWAYNPIYCNETLNFYSYGDEWLAYRHKPEGWCLA